MDEHNTTTRLVSLMSCSVVLRMTIFTDDADYDAGETSENVNGLTLEIIMHTIDIGQGALI
ncbi:unnamed protein product [Protopolystoma xenopodis]|uniref:Uncharacterized protein n=1 Tax=Protopolystoma xenopodis TaxID=117903 RepID=A0A448XNH5_9PLAT|nr:unnamed protein product [Protopolystoma xenopodis]